jgi:hypothetical protein
MDDYIFLKKKYLTGFVSRGGVCMCVVLYYFLN